MGKDLRVLGQMAAESWGQHGGWAGPHSLGKRDCMAQQPLASYLMALCLSFSIRRIKMLPVSTL